MSDEVEWIDLKEIAKAYVELIKNGEAKKRPCMQAKEGQTLMWLNCPDCGYAHERWGNP